MLLQSECENCVTCQNFLLKYFRKWLKIHEICEIKDLVLYRAATTWLNFISYILCHDMTICHDMRFISEITIYHCMEKSCNSLTNVW